MDDVFLRSVRFTIDVPEDSDVGRHWLDVCICEKCGESIFDGREQCAVKSS